MFEQQIAQGHDMIRRLEAESRLTEPQRNALPSSERVPLREAAAWQETIEQQIRLAFGADTFARYRVAWDRYKEELDRNAGDEYSRALNAWRRVIAFLIELDVQSIGPSSAQDARRSADASGR